MCEDWDPYDYFPEQTMDEVDLEYEDQDEGLDDDFWDGFPEEEDWEWPKIFRIL